MRRRWIAILFLTALFAGSANAATITHSGSFNDSGNTALVWSDLTAALFDNDNNIANNVAVYGLTIPFGGAVSFTSLGYSGGGAEPYFTLFSGSGNTATFLDSNFFIPAIDFSLSRVLSAGSYTLALGVWENMSFAENSGVGTLGDGFIRLGDPSRLGNYHYELQIEIPDTPTQPPSVSEPSSVLLLGSGLAAIAAIIARRRKVLREERPA